MNDRVVGNPNFQSEGEFHKTLVARGAGAKDYPNSHTEVEYLSGGKFAASIGVGHKVFFDKADANKPKRHKLTDERPTKSCVLIQSAQCCVEVYPYYAKYFDPTHSEVRLYEERWVVQRLFKAPDEWRDVGAYNPAISVGEYSEPAGDVVKVTVTYNTDYGVLAVEYFQRDSNALKHNVTFKNTFGSTQTFRVFQRWAGIVGAKCNGKDFPVDVVEPFLAFHRADKPQTEFTIAENLWGMMFNPDGSGKTEKCLQRPVKVESQAQGMKTDFIYGSWTLARNESLEIDPATVTLDNPTEDADIRYQTGPIYNRYPTGPESIAGVENGGSPPFSWLFDWRFYIEWDVSSIPDGATITDVVFKYNGKSNNANQSVRIMAMANRPSTSNDATAYGDCGDGTAYLTYNATFPEAGTNKAVGTGGGVAWSDLPSLKSDLQSALLNNWFALGCQGNQEGTGGHTSYLDEVWAEDYATPTPPPTLYVEYTLPAVVGSKSANMAAKLVAAGVI